MRYTGTLTTDARGKLGGVVFTRARNGTNVKAQGVSTAKATAAQQLARSGLAAAAAAWNVLSAADQATWSALAAQYTLRNSLGQTYSPTGRQLWNRAWIASDYTDSGFSHTAPSSPPVIQPCTAVGLELASGTLAAVFYAGGDLFTGWVALFLTRPLSPARTSTRTLPHIYVGTSNYASTADVTTPYLTRYGSLPSVGDRVGARFYTSDPPSGLPTPPLIQVVTVTT
jgi:hypothetical protein